jgi:Response regulator containing CheY-like receiver, AAA-type ATPase, and DNA-binding domains
MRTNILIVDDSYTNRVLFRAILEDFDIEVSEAHNAVKALEMLNDMTPTLILLDMCMPVMSGVDFLKELKLTGKQIPVIVVSVLDDQMFIDEAYELGARDYLVKPVEVDELLRHIAPYTETELIH